MAHNTLQQRDFKNWGDAIAQDLRDIFVKKQAIFYYNKHNKLRHGFIYQQNNGLDKIEKMIESKPKQYDLTLEVRLTWNGGNYYISLDKITRSNFVNLMNSNGDGKKFADAVELATIAAIEKPIVEIDDCGKNSADYFCDHVRKFEEWVETFNQSAKEIRKVMGLSPTQSKLNEYRIIHDATKKEDPIAQIFYGAAAKVGLRKDAFCPADIYIVKKSEEQNIKDKFEEISEIKSQTNSERKNYVSHFNTILNNCFEGKDGLSKRCLIPFSLKKIKGHARSKLVNKPTHPYPYYKIAALHCKATMVNGKEIGSFVFTPSDPNLKEIKIQHRTFPYRYNVAQTEVTDDGTGSGGRPGKTPTWYIDMVLTNYGFNRIKSVDEIGKNHSGEWTMELMKKSNEWLKKWEYIQNLSKSEAQNKSSIRITSSERYDEESFKKLLEDANTDIKKAESICNHIQGLNMLHFLTSNPDKLSDIVTALVNGANKATEYNSFYVKIY